MTTPTPGNTTVTQASNGGFFGSLFNDTIGFGLAKDAVAPAVSTYEATKAGIKDTASATEAVANVAVQGAEWMANPHNWVRVAMVVIGGAVILIGVYVAFKDTGAGRATGATIKGGTKLAALA